MFESNRTSFRSAREANWGVIPTAPAFSAVRVTSADIMPKKEVVESAEIEESAQLVGTYRVHDSSEASFEGELSADAYTPFMEAALRSQETNPVDIDAGDLAGSITLAASGSTLTFSSEDDYLLFSKSLLLRIHGGTGTTPNRDLLTVAETDDENFVITVNETLEDEVITSASSVTISGSVIRNGTEKLSHIFELIATEGADKAVVRSTGNDITELSFAVESRQLVKVSVKTMGKDYAFDTNPLAFATTPAPTNSPMNASVDVVSFGVSSFDPSVAKVDLTITNDVADRPAVGQQYSLRHRYGTLRLKGTLSAYLDTGAMAALAAYSQHTAVPMTLLFKGTEGDYLQIYAPAVRLSDAKLPASAKDTDRMVDFELAAEKHPTLGYTLQIDRVSAPPA